MIGNLDMSSIANNAVGAMGTFGTPFTLLVGGVVAFICFSLIYSALKK